MADSPTSPPRVPSRRAILARSACPFLALIVLVLAAVPARANLLFATPSQWNNGSAIPFAMISTTGALLATGNSYGNSGIAVNPELGLIYAGPGAGGFDVSSLTATSDPLPKFPLLATVPVGAPAPGYGGDMAFDGTWLYRTDTLADRILRIDPVSGATTVFKTFEPYEQLRPIGLAWNGHGFYVGFERTSYIWSLDRDGNVIGDFQIAFRPPTYDYVAGLAYQADNDSLWVGGIGRIYNFGADGTFLGSIELTSPFAAPNVTTLYVHGLEFVNARTPGDGGGGGGGGGGGNPAIAEPPIATLLAVTLLALFGLGRGRVGRRAT